MYRSIFALFVCCGLFGGVFAQSDTLNTDPELTDTTEIALKKRKFIIVSDGDETRITIRKDENEDGTTEFFFDNDDYNSKQIWVGKRRNYSRVGVFSMDLGVTNFYHDGNFGKDAIDPRLELQVFRPGSHIGLHFLPTYVSLIGRGRVGLTTALTVDLNHYNFVNDITLQTGDTLGIVETGDDFRRNRLFVSYAQLPLLLKLSTRPRGKGVSISAGAYVGVRWQSRTKQRVGGERIKVREDFNLNPIRYGLTARLSFRWFKVYANYNLSPLFVEGEGPEVQTFTAGFNLFGF